MKILIDTNILMDFFLRRADFEDASSILNLAARRQIIACIAAHTVTTLGYFMKKNERYKGQLNEQLAFLFETCRVLPVDGDDLKQAMNSPITDYEDAVVETVAFRHGTTCIVTRDKKDFKKSRLQTLNPSEFLKWFHRESSSDDFLVREPTPDYHARPRRRQARQPKKLIETSSKSERPKSKKS